MLFFLGFVVAAMMYAEFTRNGILSLFKNPVLLLVTFMPFLPAAFFTWRSSFHSDELYKKLSELENEKAKSAGSSKS